MGKTPGDYSIHEGLADASCSHTYYTCDAQLQLQEKSCAVTTSGSYFNAVSKQCVSGNPSTTCKSKFNFCVQ